MWIKWEHWSHSSLSTGYERWGRCIPDENDTVPVMERNNEALWRWSHVTHESRGTSVINSHVPIAPHLDVHIDSVLPLLFQNSAGQRNAFKSGSSQYFEPRFHSCVFDVSALNQKMFGIVLFKSGPLKVQSIADFT